MYLKEYFDGNNFQILALKKLNLFVKSVFFSLGYKRLDIALNSIETLGYRVLKYDQ